MDQSNTFHWTTWLFYAWQAWLLTVNYFYIRPNPILGESIGLCMCLCVCVCVVTRMCVGVWFVCCMYVCPCLCVCVCIAYPCFSLCVCVWVFVCPCLFVRLCVSLCVSVFVSKYIMYAYICIHAWADKRRDSEKICQRKSYDKEPQFCSRWVYVCGSP